MKTILELRPIPPEFHQQASQMVAIPKSHAPHFYLLLQRWHWFSQLTKRHCINPFHSNLSIVYIWWRHFACNSNLSATIHSFACGNCSCITFVSTLRSPSTGEWREKLCITSFHYWPLWGVCPIWLQALAIADYLKSHFLQLIKSIRGWIIRISISVCGCRWIERFQGISRGEKETKKMRRIIKWTLEGISIRRIQKC